MGNLVRRITVWASWGTSAHISVGWPLISRIIESKDCIFTNLTDVTNGPPRSHWFILPPQDLSLWLWFFSVNFSLLYYFISLLGSKWTLTDILKGLYPIYRIIWGNWHHYSIESYSKGAQNHFFAFHRI